MTKSIEMLGEGEYPIAGDYLIALHEFAAEHGISANELLKGTGIPMSALVKPEARIGHLSNNQVIQNIQAAIPDPYLPIRYGRRLSLSKHGVMGSAAQSSENYMEAAQIITQYMSTRSGGHEIFEFHLRGNHGVFRLTPLEDIPDPALLSFHVLTTFFSIDTICRNINEHPEAEIKSLMHLSFDLPLPIPAELLSPGLSISIKQENNELIYPLSFLKQPLRQSSPTLKQIAQQECDEELQSLNQILSGVQDFPVVVRVKNYLREFSLDNLENRFPTIEHIARQLNTSSRTLKRKLNEAGTNYRHLKDSERFRAARKLLETSSDNMETIAEKLGYSDASNFTKAFKNWAMISPGEFRKRFKKSGKSLFKSDS